MIVTIRLFGREADVMQQRVLHLELSEPATVASLRAALAAAHPPHAPLLTAARVAVNHAFATDDTAITAADELALIGSVSGG